MPIFLQNGTMSPRIDQNMCVELEQIGLLSDEFHCQRQIRNKSLAMDFQRVLHSDNFHNILCNPWGHFFPPVISLSIFSCLFLSL